MKKRHKKAHFGLGKYFWEKIKEKTYLVGGNYFTIMTLTVKLLRKVPYVTDNSNFRVQNVKNYPPDT